MVNLATLEVRTTRKYRCTENCLHLSTDKRIRHDVSRGAIFVIRTENSGDRNELSACNITFHFFAFKHLNRISFFCPFLKIRIVLKQWKRSSHSARQHSAIQCPHIVLKQNDYKWHIEIKSIIRLKSIKQWRAFNWPFSHFCDTKSFVCRVSNNTWRVDTELRISQNSRTISTSRATSSAFEPGAIIRHSGFVLALEDMLLNVRSRQMACKWCIIKTRATEAIRR